MLTDLFEALGVEDPVMGQVVAFATLLSVFVMALVQVIKTTVSVPKNLVPLIGFGIGLVVGAVGYPFTDLELVLRLWAGGIAGLAATGIFETFFNKRDGTTK